jgi:hypothetical protein
MPEGAYRQRDLAGKLLSAIVYHASAQDPFVLFAVAITMLLTASLSIANPVRRALNIDPARLLREEQSRNFTSLRPGILAKFTVAF